MGIQDEIAREWNQYTHRLKLGSIKLRDEEDEIVWSKNKATRNLGILARIKKEFLGEKTW